MKLYHKIFKSRADMSVYLENMDPLISYDEELLNRLTNARNLDELHNAKRTVLKDFHDIYAFDASDAEFPEPIGHFDNGKEKIKFIRKKILLQDIAFYLQQESWNAAWFTFSGRRARTGKTCILFAWFNL